MLIINSLLICALLEKSINHIFKFCMKSELIFFEDLNIQHTDMYIIISKNTHQLIFHFLFNQNLIIKGFFFNLLIHKIILVKGYTVILMINYEN